MAEISRRLLARAALSPQAMQVALDVSGLRPARSEWRDFAVRAMRFAGIVSLAAGVVFLVAFNWQNLGLYARFVMVEVPLLGALAVAFIKGTRTLSGKLALMLAVMLTGALLALYGETYQTGADVYELFFGWALLALPWVVACRFGPCWALWFLLLNTATAIYSGTTGFSWIFHRREWSPWFLPFLLNLVIYGALIGLDRWKDLGLSSGWLRRAIAAIAMGFGTCAMVYRIAGGGSSSDGADAASLVEFILYAAASMGFAAYAYSGKQDLFNFAILSLSWIVVTTTLIGRALLEGDSGVGALFVIAIYVIAASTGAVKGISRIARQWRTQQA